MPLNKGYLTCGRDAASDEVMTPFYAVEPLVKYVYSFAALQLKRPQEITIWCPFDEEWSAYVQTFKNNGFNVIFSSLVNKQDFFNYMPDGNFDIIISNPPFSKKDDVLKKLYGINKPFAVLLPVNSLQGRERFDLFKKGIQLLSFDKRIDFHTTNMKEVTKGTPFASAYFCRNFLPKDLIIEELIKFDKPLRED